MPAKTTEPNPTSADQTLQEDVPKAKEPEHSTQRDNLGKIPSNGKLDGHSIGSNASTDVQKGKLGGFPCMKAWLNHADIHAARDPLYPSYNQLLRQLRVSHQISDGNVEYLDDIFSTQCRINYLLKKVDDGDVYRKKLEKYYWDWLVVPLHC